MSTGYKKIIKYLGIGLGVALFILGNGITHFLEILQNIKSLFLKFSIDIFLVSLILTVAFAFIAYLVGRFSDKSYINANRDMSIAAIGLLGGIFGAIFWNMATKFFESEKYSYALKNMIGFLMYEHQLELYFFSLIVVGILVVGIAYQLNKHK